MALDDAFDIDVADIINGDGFPTPRAVKFNGRAPPGRSYPTGAGSPRKWDEQGGYGFSGATLIYMGNGLSEFDVIVDVWEERHFREWNSFAPIIEKAPRGSKAKAIEFIHPLVNRSPVRITKVVILDCSQFEAVGDTGLWSCRIRCKDARIAMPALGKPDGIPDVAGAKPPADAELDKNTAEIDELKAKLAASQGLTGK